MKIYKIITHVGGSIAFAAMQWLILIFISKYMGVSEAGSFSYYLAFFAPLGIFCAFNLKSVYSSDSLEKFDMEQYEAIRSILIIIYLISSMSFLVLQKEYLLIGLMVFMVKLIEVSADLIYGEWVKKGESQLFGYSKILKLFLFVLMFFILYFLDFERFIYVIYPLAFILGYFLFDLRKTDIKLKFDLNKSKPIFLGVLPFVLTSFFISFNTSVPRFYLNYFYDKKIIAEFMYLTYFTTIMLLPLTSLYQAILPKIKKYQKNILAITMIYNFVFLMFFWFFCDYILREVYNYNQIIPKEIKLLIMASMFIQALIVYVNMLYVSSMKFRKIFKVTLINTFIVLILSFIMIDKLGYIGVYYAGVISSIILLINLYFNYRRDGINEL